MRLVSSQALSRAARHAHRKRRGQKSRCDEFLAARGFAMKFCEHVIQRT
jgi:hypothetical protein